VDGTVSEGYFKFDDTDWKNDLEAVEGKDLASRMPATAYHDISPRSTGKGKDFPFNDTLTG
jgi:hypothetical protein